MVCIPILMKCKCGPFVANHVPEAAAIIEDLKSRCGAIKIAECDDGVVLDAEALMECLEEDLD